MLMKVKVSKRWTYGRPASAPRPLATTYLPHTFPHTPQGSTVPTKHGNVSTEHVLFICSGAFHSAKPSDMLAELQVRRGRERTWGVKGRAGEGKGMCMRKPCMRTPCMRGGRRDAACWRLWCCARTSTVAECDEDGGARIVRRTLATAAKNGNKGICEPAVPLWLYMLKPFGWLLPPASKCLPPCCQTWKLPHPPSPASSPVSCPQGRLPIRVELKGLTAEDFYRILTEPENNMLRQQQVRRTGAVGSPGVGGRVLDGENGQLPCWAVCERAPWARPTSHWALSPAVHAPATQDRISHRASRRFLLLPPRHNCLPVLHLPQQQLRTTWVPKCRPVHPPPPRSPLPASALPMAAGRQGPSCRATGRAPPMAHSAGQSCWPPYTHFPSSPSPSTCPVHWLRRSTVNPSFAPLPLPQELLATEGVALSFTEGAVRALASLAEQVGQAAWGPVDAGVGGFRGGY